MQDPILVPGHNNLRPNGTVGSLRSSGGTQLLYPERRLVIDGVEKLRGGSPTMLPLVGPQPNNPVWQRCALAQHGLIRTLEGYKAHDTEDEVYKSGRGRAFWWEASDLFPWSFLATVESMHQEGQLRTDNTRHCLEWHHRIRCKFMGDDLAGMPCMVGGHPYFATHGYGGQVVLPDDTCIPITLELKDNPQRCLLFEPNTPEDERWSNPVLIKLSYGTIELYLAEGYTGVVVWTDHPDYICVEPVRGFLEATPVFLQPEMFISCEFVAVFPLG